LRKIIKTRKDTLSWEKGGKIAVSDEKKCKFKGKRKEYEGREGNKTGSVNDPVG